MKPSFFCLFAKDIFVNQKQQSTKNAHFLIIGLEKSVFQWKMSDKI